MGLEVEEDGAGAAVGSDAGNLLARDSRHRRRTASSCAPTSTPSR